MSSKLRFPKRKPKPLVKFFFVGWNDHGQPVLAARCKCKWQHMTAYANLGEGMQYLMKRFLDHYISSEHKG